MSAGLTLSDEAATEALGAAIAEAIAEADAGDIVLIAGKGHETYQEVDGVKTPFDDRAVAGECLQVAA